MASAVLASQNEPALWAQSSYMAKLPYSNPVIPNPNPNSVPKKKRRQVPNGWPAEDSPVVTQVSSGDAYSYNQRPIDQNVANPNFNFNPGSYISFDLSNCTKTKLAQIKNRLVAELDSVRRLNLQIESGKFRAQKKKRVSAVVPAKDSKRLCQQVPISDAAERENLMKMCKQVLGKMMKHKLSWVFNKPVDAAALGLHDYHHIIKRPMDLGTVKANLGKNFYSSPAEFAADVRLTFNNALLYNPQGDEVHKMADQLLTLFEELYRPIQARYKIENVEIDELQGSSWNISPPPEKPKESKPKPKPMPFPVAMPMRVPPKKSEKKEIPQKKSEKLENVSREFESLSNLEMVPKLPLSPPLQQQLPMKPTAGRGSSAKLPRPRAKDPNKRAMSMEEKHKLSIGLQSLPQEKMPQLVHIIKKRNANMVQEGDEIELDIEAIDTETLWELDRFVMNWKKMVSKTKRQALMANATSASAPVETETASGEDNVVSDNERTEAVTKSMEEEGGGYDVDAGEDVDIGDANDVPMNSFAPVEIEKDDGGGGTNENNDGHAGSSSSSSSGSSSSDSSSSSVSDSGSSSGSDSDAADA